MDGFIVVDKPAGVTSHDVVRSVRRIMGVKKGGHTGTLDPFATGVLAVALGEGTKAIPFLDESLKEYQAVMRLGLATDTQDFTGSVVAERDWSRILRPDVEEVVRLFTGKIRQLPPMFSALKRNGVPLYKIARRGEQVQRESREVVIYSLVVDAIELPDVSFTVRCSRGTYVRSLANDMGEKLGCGAHLLELRRTRSGPFAIADAVSLESLAVITEAGGVDEILVTPYAALSHLQDIPLNDQGTLKVSRGMVPDAADMVQCLPHPLLPGERVRFSHRGRLLAVAETAADGRAGEGRSFRLVRVFN